MNNKLCAAALFCALIVCGSALAELTGMDIGTTWPPNPIGSLTIVTPDSNYTVTAAGRDIWGNADSFHYSYEPVLVSGDFEAIVRVDSLSWLHDPGTVYEWAKAGIMARANLTEYSPHAFACRSGHNGIHLQARQFEGGHSITKDLGSGDVFGISMWLKLARKGNVFAVWYASDVGGSPDSWQNPAVTWVDMPNLVYLGLATTSHDNIPPNNVVKAEYSNFSVGPLTGFPPLPNFGPFPGPEGGIGYMGIREVIDNGDILNQDDCNDSLTSGAGTIVDYNAQVLNIYDSGDDYGHLGGDDVFGVVTAGHRAPGDVNHLSLVAKGTVEIPTDGEYTFCLNTDDGVTLQFPGHDFASVYGPPNYSNNVYPEIVPFANGNALRFWDVRPPADTLGVINLPAGKHKFIITFHETEGGAEVEFSAAQGARTSFDDDFILIGGQAIPAKPPVPNPPEINGGAGWPVTMVYEPYTTGTNFSEELDSAIENVEAAWTGNLPLPNVVVTATANWLNFKDPDAGAGGKGFPQQPFPGSDDGSDNDHFAMGAGAHPTPNRLFAIRDNIEGTYLIDITTAVPTLIGQSGVTNQSCGLTHSGGAVLYGSIPNKMSIIQTDGSGISTLGSQYMEGMAYDERMGILYGAFGTQFFTVSTATGNLLANLPPWPNTITGLAFVPSVGVHYGSVYGISNDGILYRYDVFTQDFNTVGDTGLGAASSYSGLAYAHDLDVLFHITRNDGNLYRIDKSTAAATFIANTGINGNTGFSGLAYGHEITPSLGTTMTVFDEGDYTFLMYSDDSSQFRILNLEGGDPCNWDINYHEMPGDNEIVRLLDGTGFRFHGWNVDAKGTIHLTAGDYDVQVISHDIAGYSNFGLWCTFNGSKMFLLGDTNPVPAYPQINPLELTCPYYLLGDWNKDCRIDFFDISLIALNWLTDCNMNPSDPACMPK